MISLFLTAMLGLFCCSSINTNTLDNTKEIEQRESSNKNAIHNESGNYYCATSVDLQSTHFLWMTYYRLGGNLGTNDYAFDYSFNCYATSFSNFNLSNPFQSANATYITSLSLTCLRFSYTEAGKQISNYSVTLYYDNSGTQTPYLSFTYSYIYPNIDSLNISGNEGSIFVEYEFTNRYFWWSDSNEFYRTTSYFIDVDSAETYYNQGYNDGYNAGNTDGIRDGYQSGYTDGYNDAENVDDTALTIFTGIIEVGLLPVNVFLQILNFEVFGINISGLVSATLTIAIVIIIVRIITGKKDD